LRCRWSIRILSALPWWNDTQAALELNLVTDVTDALICFQQSLGIAAPYELWCLFVSLTVAGYPTLPMIYNNEELRRELMWSRLRYGDLLCAIVSCDSLQ
jgi:hypothetical protein